MPCFDALLIRLEFVVRVGLEFARDSYIWFGRDLFARRSESLTPDVS